MRERNDHLPNASLAHLRARHRLLKNIRRFFDDRDFLEVMTPLLSSDTVIDEHLDPFAVTCFGDPTDWKTGPTKYLQTSPEFHMKRLLCAGATNIYQVTHAFRAGEIGPLHNPEFTMAEWYRVGDDMQAGIELLNQLIVEVTDETTDRLTYATAFERSVGLDPHLASLEELATVSVRQSKSTKFTDFTIDDHLHYLWSAVVTPSLGIDSPVVVYDFPASQAALAKIRDDSPPVAERFELYWQGVELANGYHELLCHDELAERAAEVAQRRKANGKMPLPSDNRLLAAMRAGMPACAGVALGVDRLLMLLCGEKSLETVLPFSFPRA